MRIIVLAFLLASLFTAVALSAASTAAPAKYDLIIRNGRVVDGTGRPAFRNDIGIAGDRIVEMGDLRNVPAERIIDARGQIVAPGFIEMMGQSGEYGLID